MVLATALSFRAFMFLSQKRPGVTVSVPGVFFICFRLQLEQILPGIGSVMDLGSWLNSPESMKDPICS